MASTAKTASKKTSNKATSHKTAAKKKNSLHARLELAVVTDPIQSAEKAGLHYVTDTVPGIQRKASGRGFCYYDADGSRVCDRDTLARIKSLVIPPAWKNVWICTLSHGHLQATGYDAKGRKQYRYHPDWRGHRNQNKFNRMVAFGLVLPKVREQTDRHLQLSNLPREKVLATVVQLLEKTHIRVGNDEYAVKNSSFGLTTMRDDHVSFSGSQVKFQFRGKSGVEHDIELSDRRLAKIVKRCQDIPGHELFQYIDEDGQRQTIHSGDVNSYLRSITGEDFTAKDFRTWSGTVQAALELKDLGTASSQTEAKKNITQAIKNVAEKLGNRPATCRKYYVHPAVLEAYSEGTLIPLLEQWEDARVEETPFGLRREEQAVLALLEQQL
ncbi:DNA topoisomerase IB [Oscillatoria sp. FACHB-1407]|uniref:DNA topoisomerase IB n=1 Tax=Oscillatoria sp. FACHB-1407 TaxID=2692847 RepID=UPI001681F676|nr:DNA topoisomerase IB [Oscillatoria sp. FACHB-1407]MBD2460915.1 DNA topoisomerase IB [Oscillatoria sp. FACHB-1407]